MRKHGIKHGLTVQDKDLTLPYSELSFDGKVLKYSDASRVSRKRVDSFFEKEPTTITWLDSFTPDDVMLDIGGNVGMYTVYAAAIRGAQVTAMEPEALNYAELNKNIYLNKLYDKVRAYCLAASNVDTLSTLFLSTFAPSYSHHDFGENRWQGPVTNIAASPEARPRQGCVSYRVDTLIDADLIPEPTHIKIDVDGFENKVVEGMATYLDNPRLKTVLIETDFTIEPNVALIEFMQNRGWQFSYDQVCTSREGKISKDEWHRRVVKKIGGCNVIYFRDPAYKELFAKATT